MRRTPRPQYGAQHQQVSTALRDQHVARYGWVCPGDPAYDHDLHPSRDLVADHLVPGHPEHGYEVVCRALNTRRMSAA